MYNRRLHEFVRSLPEDCLLTSVCTGSWVYARMGLLDGLPATNRKEPDRVESVWRARSRSTGSPSIAPACRVSRARVVDAGRVITAGGISSGLEMGFQLLRRHAMTDQMQPIARQLRAENFELRRANEILKSASVFSPRSSTRTVGRATARRPRRPVHEPAMMARSMPSTWSRTSSTTGSSATRSNSTSPRTMLARRASRA